MLNVMLPQDAAGSWIWLRSLERKAVCRVFIRKEFLLNNPAAVSELRVSALPFYHVYLNGEHVGYGPSTATNARCYVDCFDVTQYLETGLNTLALIVMDETRRTRYSHPYPPKVWCQLTAGDKTVVATGADWKIREADCYMPHQPRRHYDMEDVEKVNLAADCAGWKENGYNDAQWEQARALSPVQEGFPPPALSAVPPCLWTESEAFEPVRTGAWRDVYASSFYSYENFPVLAPGNYAAESFAFALKECDTAMKVSSDEPFVIFCNDNPVACRTQSRALTKYEAQAPRMDNEILYFADISLKKGWNRFLCFQEISGGGMGLMLLFPALKKGMLTFRREASNAALAGWRICGPLRLPLAFSSSAFSLAEREDAVNFLPLEEHVNDMSALLGNCDFAVEDPVGSGKLKQGEFAVYDLGELRYGFPLLDVDGSAGDVVDVTCGLRLDGGAVKSIGTPGRMTDTLLLRKGNNTWMRLTPRGTRYVMISIRKAAGTVTPVFRFISAPSELGSSNEFSCSDHAYTAIWNAAVSSMRHCAKQNIMDDPCGRRCQSLPEMLVYSRFLHYLSGGRAIAEKALREFGEAQLENGMILGTVPSGVYSFAPDTALLWILWLENHWLCTGDEEFLEEMIPHLDRLLEFFRLLPPEGNRLLPVERAGHCAFLNEQCAVPEKGVFFPLNALYYRALLAASRLYHTEAHRERRAVCTRRAERLAEDIRMYALNKKNGLFADYYHDGRSPECSFRTNIMILNSGMIQDTAEANRILAKICVGNTWIQQETPGVFMAFVLETLFAFGKKELACHALKQGFEYNSDRLELYERDYNPHIFNIVAGSFLIRELLGVRASAPGFAQIYFNPACDLMTGAKCRLPVAKGRIAVEWKTQDRDLQVNINSNCTLDVLPLFPPKFGATFNLGNYVNLLAPDDGSAK